MTCGNSNSDVQSFLELVAWAIVKRPVSLSHRAALIEDYIVVCLAGNAAQLICAATRRPQLRRSLEGAGPELKQLRLLWECLEPESERAPVVALGTLPVLDEGDTEATVYRLWNRARQLLTQNPQRNQLDQLARHLLTTRQLTGSAVEQFLMRIQ